MQEIEAGLPNVLASPTDNGRLVGLQTRPAEGERVELPSVDVSAASGVSGDHWSKGCWKSLPDGSPDPDVQISIINSRLINLIAGGRENWAPAGNNLFVDMDITLANLPPGQMLGIGTAELAITSVPHTGCAKFIARYGRDACVYVNRGIGRDLRLRGVYARVVRSGRISVRDAIVKLPKSIP